MEVDQVLRVAVVGTGEWWGPEHARLVQTSPIETQCHGLDMLGHLCGPIEFVVAQLPDPLPHLQTVPATTPRRPSTRT